MRILFVIRTLTAAGAERQLGLVADGLAARGHDVHAAVVRPSEGVQVVLGGEVRAHELWRSGHRPAISWTRLVRRLRPDVVYGFLDAGNAMATSARLVAGTRAVLSVRAAAVDMTGAPVRSRALASVEPHLGRIATAVIANSEAGRRDAVRRGFPAAKVRVIRNGVDLRQFGSDEEGGRTFRLDHSIAQDADVVLGVGRLHSQKAWDVFIDALARLDADRPSVVGVIVGAGDQTARMDLIRRAERSGIGASLRLLDAMPEIAWAYQAADVLVSTSRYEGTSNVIAEAMASSTPVVATDVGDARWQLGDNALLVSTSDAELVASRVRSVLALQRDQRRDLGLRLRLRAQELLSVERLVEETEAALG